MTGYDILDTLDWDEFVTRYWRRRPVMYRNVLPGPSGIDTVFSGCVEACAPNAEGQSSPLVHFTSGNRRRRDADPWTPTAADGGFDGYGRRVTSILDGESYALTVNGVHISSSSVWDAQRRFFAPLWRRVGIPRTSAITTMFHGNYEYTPVGVHQDRFATFMYVLQGRKRMRMWPKRPWDHDATTITEYAEYNSTSIAIDGDPGDLIYWPSSYLHVGENLSEEPATSINIGIPTHGHRTTYDVAELLSTEYADSMVSPQEAVSSAVAAWGGPWTVSDDDAAATLASIRDQAANEIISASNPLRRTAIALSRRSAAGFWPVPSADPLPTLHDEDRVGATGVFVIWATSDDGTVYASAGHTAELPAGVDIEGLVAALRSGESTVAALASNLPTRDVLARLVSWRAARITSG